MEVKITKLRGVLLLMFAAVVISGCGGGSGSDGSSTNSGSSNVPIIVDQASDMNVGDIMFVQMADQNLVIDFEDAPEEAQFMLATGTSSSDAATSFLMSDDLLLDIDKSIDPSPDMSGELEAAGDAYGPQEILSAWLRASEREIALAKPAPSFSASKDFTPEFSVAVGDAENFRVLRSLYSTSEYVTVTATARCVTSNIAIYVDTDVSDDVLSAGNIAEICDEFDAAAQWEFDVLGEASDINGDGIVKALITHRVNQLGASGGGIIGGYFYAADLYGRSDSNTTSDEQEIIYALAPDPGGAYGTAISTQHYLEQMIPAILPHELQHAINFNQHVFVNLGDVEESWLNEGISHLVEDLVGYGNSNPARYALFLASPSTTSLASDGSDSLPQRGAAYLFLRYLYERSADGDAFLGRLVRSELTGVENVEQAFVSNNADFDEFGEMMARWSAALMLGSHDLGNGSEFVYSSRSTDAQTGNWKGTILHGNAEDGRGTNLSGIRASAYGGYANSNIASSSAKYFTIDEVPEQIGLQAGGASNFAVLIRTQ